MYNKKDIPKLEERIKVLIHQEGTDESEVLEDFLNEIATPKTGLIYKPGENGAPGHLEIADGWTEDKEGNIIPYPSPK